MCMSICQKNIHGIETTKLNPTYPILFILKIRKLGIKLLFISKLNAWSFIKSAYKILKGDDGKWKENKYIYLFKL